MNHLDSKSSKSGVLTLFILSDEVKDTQFKEKQQISFQKVGPRKYFAFFTRKMTKLVQPLL